MSPRHYPILFVGCAVEDLAIAEAVQARLERVAEVEIWHEGTFVPSGSALQSLLSSSGRVDFALMLASHLDTAAVRSESFNIVRDNVIFELGVFFGSLGQSRTFLLTDRAAPPQLPSDLVGITQLTFDSRKANLQSAVGTACTTLADSMKQQGLRGGGNV